MTPEEFKRLAQQNIFPGESGGDYNALFGYQNRPNGRFAGTNLTDMTIDQALDFSTPSGPYGQYVKGQVGRVATPMGAYQVVGTTLRDAKAGLGLTGNEIMTEETQDLIGRYIFDTQGPGAWEAYRDGNGGQAIADDTMRALNNQQPAGGNTVNAPTPSTRNAAPRGILSNEGDQMDRQQPQGLLGSLGIQRRDPNAQGETAQPFYNRQSFGDTLARLAPALGRMGVMGLEGPAQAALDTRNQRQGEERARREKDAQTNQSLQYLKELGRDDLVAAVGGGLPIGEAIAIAIKPAEEYSPNSGIAKLQQDLQNGAITQEQFDLGLANMAPSGMSLTVGADGSINLTEGPGAGSSGTMTEGQSKDAVYATRAEGALGVLDPVANILTNAGMGAANIDPTGIIRGSVQSPEYQMAAQAGQEFLQAILRKDTGAAITPSEEDSYGQVYLPRPGDGEEVLAQKQLSRRRALEALKAGLSPTAILAQEQALANTNAGNASGATPPTAGGGADLSGMSDAELQAIVEGGQ